MKRYVIFILEDFHGNLVESNLGSVDETSIECALEMHKAFIKICGWKSEYTYRFEYRECATQNGLLCEARPEASIH